MNVCPGIFLQMNDKFKNNQSIFDKADQLIHHYQIPFSSSKEEVLDTILEKIDGQQQAKRGNPLRKITWFSVAGGAAAAVIFLLVAFYFFTASVTISAGKEEIIASRLPDASRVVLHNGSEIEFRKYFWNRQVQLSGEAYFEVTKEEGEGFKVETAQGAIDVLGTRFLVSEKGSEFKVQCFQGRVRTHYRQKSWLLEPGSQFLADNKTAEQETFDIERGYPEFALFSESFSNEQLANVVKELALFFDAEIKIQNGAGKNFTGTFQTGNLESAIQIICESLQLNYRFAGKNNIIIYK
jgi:transmembrane sensor